MSEDSLLTALFFTGCRFHEWARLTMDRLVREPGGVIIAERLQVKGSSFRDLPLTKELATSLEEWFAFLESVKGVRLRGGAVEFAGSPLIFPGRDGAPFSNQAFNARIKLAYCPKTDHACLGVRAAVSRRRWMKETMVRRSRASGSVMFHEILGAWAVGFGV